MIFFKKKNPPDFKPTEYGNFKPGDLDPTTGKEIIYIAYQTKKFYVSIDSSTNLNWNASEDMKYAVDFGEIVSQVSLTEALVDRIFRDRKNRVAYKKILADVISRLLDENDSKTARLIMEEAKLRVVGHSQERVRMTYIYHAVLSVIFVGLLVILIVLNKPAVLEALGNDKEIFRILICTLLGGIGAFITTFSRFKDYKGSIISGLGIHKLDGILRVFYGLIAGLIIALAIKGKVFAGFADFGSPWILYFFAMIAGASEALIPNLIRQADDQLSLKKVEPMVQDPILPSKGAGFVAVTTKTVGEVTDTVVEENATEQNSLHAAPSGTHVNDAKAANPFVTNNAKTDFKKNDHIPVENPGTGSKKTNHDLPFNPANNSNADKTDLSTSDSPKQEPPKPELNMINEKNTRDHTAQNNL